MTEQEGTQRYRLESLIATGGMGEVWRATDQVLGREVAVKLLKHEYADDPTFRSRFETEARNAAALHHANVASVFDYGELPADDGGTPRPYLVMELVRGEPLSALLRGDEPISPEPAADLIAQAADGLAAAHELGIVHRDVKPANLLVTPSRTVKVTDFGIARAADAVSLTQTGQVVGTPQYLSPEQAEGRPTTAASDIYSLGVVLYECLAGRRPFDGGSPIAIALAHVRDEPPELPADVPAHLRETVAVALRKDPQQRFASVADMAAALRGGPVPGAAAVATGSPDPDAPTAVVGAAGALAGAGVAAAAADRAGQDPGDDPPTRTIAPAPRDPDPQHPGPPDPDRERRDRRRTPAWLPWLLAAAAVAAVLVVVAILANGRDEGRTTGETPSSSPSASRSVKPSTTPTSSAPTPTSSAPTTKAPETVQVDAGDYVGRPAEDASKDLKALGLKVREQKVDNPGDQQQDTVADVNPTGDVTKGSTVTLSVYDAPAKTPGPSDGGTSGGPGDATSSTPGDGSSGSSGNNGNGNGNGNG